MDAGTMLNYQICQQNQTGQTCCDILYDVNKHSYGYSDSSDWSTISDIEPPYSPDYQSHSAESLPDPAIHDFINLILPNYVDNSEFRNMTPESDTDSVMLSDESLRDLTCGRPEEYLDSISDSSVGSGQFDSYPAPHITSQVYHPYNNNQVLPSIDQLLQPTNRHYQTTTGPVGSDDEGDEESEAIVKKGKRGAKNILLWKFLLDELADVHQKHIRWISCKEGTFRFVDTAEISKMWGAKKRKNDMNFEKLSRGIRHYYKSGFMRREDGTRLVYKFNWKKVPKEYRRRFAL